jgi:hypothetical protein
MSQLDPTATTVADLCSAALVECGAWGVGQTPSQSDVNDAQARLQWMLQQWERQRWLVYHLVDYAKVSTGALGYSIGPGGDFDTNPNPGGGPTTRPAKIESSFLRQLESGVGPFAPPFGPPFGGPTGGIDYPMTLLFSREDYNRIALKGLMSFPGFLFYDSAWPLGFVYPWPVPQPSIYELHITVREQLPAAFANSSVAFNLPYEYYSAMLYNLALRLRPKYGLSTWPGDHLPGLAKDSLAVIRPSNAQIQRLNMPGDLVRPQLYNIFSDRMY